MDRPQQQTLSYPSSAFQFARSSCCLGSKKGCGQVCSAHCTGNQCRSSSDSPPHSLHTQHSGPDPKSGAPCQFLMFLWWRLALRNLRRPKCPILGALVRGYWICQTHQYIYKPPIWIDFKFLHPLEGPLPWAGWNCVIAIMEMAFEGFIFSASHFDVLCFYWTFISRFIQVILTMYLVNSYTILSTKWMLV